MRLLRRLLGTEDADIPEAYLAPLAPEHTVYVVGDVHGCDVLLDRLLAKIERDAQLNGEADPRLVLVGDYVDRGEQSAQVLRRVHDLDLSSPGVVCLKGNHEQMMLDFLDDPDGLGKRWLRHGGLQTLASFGIGGVTESGSGTSLRSVAETLRNAMGRALEDWVRNLETSWVSGNLVVTHAALDPELPLAAQPERFMLWGHPDFMDTARSDGLWVAHGHVVVDMPVVAQGRISVDTGAVFTGRLTAAALRPNAQPEFLQA